MKHSKLLRIFAALLALFLLGSCGAEKAEAPTPSPEIVEPAEAEDEITVEAPAPVADADAASDVVRVSTVDEFLDAIAPNTTIELAAGTYDLSTASNYGLPTDSRYYRWNDPSPDGEGIELEILGAEGLTIRGAGREETSIVAVPRYVNVLRFSNCRDLTVEGLTAGHTQEPGICSGGVLYFENCLHVSVDGCGLYGCGTVGVWGFLCEDLSVTGSHIYMCSSSAVEVSSCRSVTVDGCEVYRIGYRQDWPAYALFAAHECSGFRVLNCRVYDNDSNLLLLSDQTTDCLFLSNLLENNQISNAFLSYRYCPVVAGCLFVDQDLISSWYAGDGLLAVGMSGEDLDDEAMETMRYQRIDPTEVLLLPKSSGGGEPAEAPADGVITVTTPDEFLQAIGPDRTIVLDGSSFPLYEAEGYGGIGNKYYYWSEVWDGQELVIENVENLTIRAASASPADTELTVVPRYANVLHFINCSDLHLEGFTAGHTREQGECVGGVLDFDTCVNVTVDSCRLYGCGILGIWSESGSGLTVNNCEIYDCSYGGVILDNTSGASFTDCSIHDVPSPALSFSGCYGVLWNGRTYSDGIWDLSSPDELIPAERGDYFGDYEEEDPIPESVSVIYQSRAVEELILKTGDSVILQAEGYFPYGNGSKAKYSWSCDDPAVLSLTVGRDSRQCVVKVLGEALDGVLLTLDCGGVQQQLRIYCIGG